VLCFGYPEGWVAPTYRSKDATQVNTSYHSHTTHKMSFDEETPEWLQDMCHTWDFPESYHESGSVNTRQAAVVIPTARLWPNGSVS
jgi:hypothetical protein